MVTYVYNDENKSVVQSLDRITSDQLLSLQFTNFNTCTHLKMLLVFL